MEAAPARVNRLQARGASAMWMRWLRKTRSARSGWLQRFGRI